MKFINFFYLKDAIIESVAPGGKFIVKFTGYGNSQLTEPQDIKELEHPPIPSHRPQPPLSPRSGGGGGGGGGGMIQPSQVTTLRPTTPRKQPYPTMQALPQAQRVLRRSNSYTPEELPTVVRPTSFNPRPAFVPPRPARPQVTPENQAYVSNKTTTTTTTSSQNGVGSGAVRNSPQRNQVPPPKLPPQREGPPLRKLPRATDPSGGGTGMQNGGGEGAEREGLGGSSSTRPTYRPLPSTYGTLRKPGEKPVLPPRPADPQSSFATTDRLGVTAPSRQQGGGRFMNAQEELEFLRLRVAQLESALRVDMRPRGPTQSTTNTPFLNSPPDRPEASSAEGDSRMRAGTTPVRRDVTQPHVVQVDGPDGGQSADHSASGSYQTFRHSAKAGLQKTISMIDVRKILKKDPPKSPQGTNQGGGGGGPVVYGGGTPIPMTESGNVLVLTPKEEKKRVAQLQKEQKRKEKGEEKRKKLWK